MMRLATCFRVALAIFVVSACAFAQGMKLESKDGSEVRFPTNGQVVLVKSSNKAAAELRVAYRPNSKTIKNVVVKDPTDGVFEWTPESPGLAALAIHGSDGAVVESKNVSVRFESVSLVGLVVMIFAALLLFGGAFISIRALLRADKA